MNEKRCSQPASHSQSHIISSFFDSKGNVHTKGIRNTYILYGGLLGVKFPIKILFMSRQEQVKNLPTEVPLI